MAANGVLNEMWRTSRARLGMRCSIGVRFPDFRSVTSTFSPSLLKVPICVAAVDKGVYAVIILDTKISKFKHRQGAVSVSLVKHAKLLNNYFPRMTTDEGKTFIPPSGGIINKGRYY